MGIKDIISKIKHQSKSKKIQKIIVCVLVIIFIISALYIYNYYCKQKKSDNIYQVTKDISNVDNVSTDESDNTIDKIDFDALWAINPDIYAYIKIPGTDISYPILQSKDDNSYYLEHTVEKVNGLPGSIYTENFNTKKFIDRNTVIYGHNMINGSMFAQLYKFSDADFFNQNQYVYIYLPDKTLKYRIFAAFMFDDRHILASFNPTNVSSFKDFLTAIYSVNNGTSNYNEDVKVDENNKIITLSTCMPNNMPNNRWLVEAVLVNE